ncbi:methyltetrahydrofolate cobalamin methyltransferase [Desulforhopalus singaporensis]|uniref:5-methyltetrahydrofolate--homocysteine methyltransferase n=1 Tax=Desulforhopalus singaporensis TaxID=91360 RepID=A0A1H0KDQ1_9BACT|nr:methyltetrahydrofolate cobalamin methyltransferase [Desulforhopalus singaporensis]SDO53966.1 5-methyltetrahydrofolate--homocysteine methyltransferase [Desulforhopalus singaporensis]
MIVVGELINASRKAIGEAILNQDVAAIQKVAKDQEEAGANYIDVNAGIFVEEEGDYLKWLVETVQEVVDVPCAIDSPSYQAIEGALKVHKGDAPPMINSISLEKERYEALLPILAGTDLKVVALCMSDEGMPETTKERLDIAEKLINGLTGVGVKLDNIFVDPLVQPVSTNAEFGMEFINAVEAINKEFKGVHTMCGLSNISFGLPNRKFLNQTFAVMAIAKGLDGLIINPLDKKMMANMIAAESLAGRDNYCGNYLKAHRAGKFDL